MARWVARPCKIRRNDSDGFRVRPENFNDQHILLRESSYRVYRNSVWFAPRARFKKVMPEESGKNWRIGNVPAEEGKTIVISQPLEEGRGMLKLPLSAWEIDDLPVLKLKRNQYGAFKVEEGP